MLDVVGRRAVGGNAAEVIPRAVGVDERERDRGENFFAEVDADRPTGLP